MRRYRRHIALLLTAGIVASTLAACGSNNDDGSKDKITLEAPVGVTADYDIASRRDMYEVEIYSSAVCPVVTEYSFAKEQTFKKYGITPGEAVKKGDILIYSQTDELDKQIESLEEQIEDSAAVHQIQVDALNKDIKDAGDAVVKAFEPYNKMLEFEPDENSDYYDSWAAGAVMPEGAYERAVLNKQRIEENLRQSEELYALEYEYQMGNLNRIREKILQATITSDTDGEVVASNFYSDGDSIAKETPVIAVGDTTQRVLQTEYISKGNINKAYDIYAIIDGKRYEVDYVVMEPEEYRQKSDAGETVHTSFVLNDPTGEVQIGAYAVVVLEKDRRSDVLCVPSDAVKKEADGYYVYLFDGNESKYVQVMIGMRDGMYTEILSGIQEGDMVLSSSAPKKGQKTATLAYGDHSIEAKYDGFLFYPFTELIKNPAKTGDVYLKEIFVESNQRVEKDEVLATIEVIPDRIEIDRLNRRISRLQTRLDKMRKEKVDNDGRKIIDRGLERSIAENERTIAQSQRQLNKLAKYNGIVEIKAPYAGIISVDDRLKPGDKLTSDTNIVEIADDSRSYVIVKDDKNQLNYGNEVEIVVSSSNGASTVHGKVVSVNAMALSKEMVNEYALIAISKEEMESLNSTTMVSGGRWDRNSFKVSVNVRSEKNVLIVPKTAVIAKDKSTYVTVLKEDGSVENVSFIPGGSDSSSYWVVDGLTEGMTVCWE